MPPSRPRALAAFSTQARAILSAVARRAAAMPCGREPGSARCAAGLRRGWAGSPRSEAELDIGGVADGDRAFNLTWHDWLNLRSLILVSRRIVVASEARGKPRRAFPRGLPADQSGQGWPLLYRYHLAGRPHRAGLASGAFHPVTAGRKPAGAGRGIGPHAAAVARLAVKLALGRGRGVYPRPASAATSRRSPTAC